jgi:hypothetical protein
MIEHMFDAATPPNRESVVEVELRRMIDEYLEAHAIVLDFRHHGSGAIPWRGGDDSPESAEPAEAPESAELGPFGRMLETGAAHLAGAQRAFRAQARLAAVQARELTEFARQRPAALFDRPDDEVGAAAAASRAARPAVLTEVSEWAVDEVMAALGLPSRTASKLLSDSVALVEQLPATFAALEAGAISWPHARMLVEVLAPLGDDARVEVEHQLLADAAGRTVAQLKAAARRAVLRVDAKAAAERMVAAIREREVRVFPGEDGLATLSAVLPAPVALACLSALEGYADACAMPEDERTKAQRMVDCLADLILRPGAGTHSPVQAQLTVVASVDTLNGGSEPGEIDGHPVPAVLVRELAYALGLLARPEQPTDEGDSADEMSSDADIADEAAATEAAATEAAATAATAATAQAAEAADNDVADDVESRLDGKALGPSDSLPAETLSLSAGERAAPDLAALLGIRTTAGTGLAELPAIAVVEAISGQLLALTSAAEIRRVATCGLEKCRTGRRVCTHPPNDGGLGPPPDTAGYAPSAALQRFVRARDRRCRFPGCRARAIRCDLDHNVPWPLGSTSAENLCCLCRHHHRLSHQAPGWQLRRLAAGRLEWTLPSGERITTCPPRYGTDDDRPPPESPAEPPLTDLERVIGRPLPAGTVDDDPPGF